MVFRGGTTVYLLSVLGKMIKKFIQKIFYFSLPVIAIAYPLDFGLSYYLKQTNSYPAEYEVWNDIYTSRAECDIAIYGSSRAWVHIDPEIISETLGGHVYNFGIDGHNFWLQYLRHLEFCKYNKKPSKIILSLDIFTLQKRKGLYELNQFLPYMLWNSNIRNYTSSYEGYNKIDYYVPLIRYLGKSNCLELIRNDIINTPANFRYRKQGFLGLNKKWNNDLDNAMKEMKSYEAKLDNESIKLFEEFILECKSSDIELIFVYTPEYIEGQKFTVNRNDIIKLYKFYSKKYSIDFYDYSNDSLCYEKKYFYNSNHLNKIGARIFSKKLATKIKLRNDQNISRSNY